MIHFDIYSRYFYSKLTESEKNVYIKVQDAWLNYKEKIIIKNKAVHVDLQKVFEAVREDTPELFYIDTTKISATFVPGAIILATKFIYSKTDCEVYKEQIMHVVENVKSKAKASGNKEKTIHDFLVSNVVYSKDLSNNDSFTVKGALISRKAVCEGFARSFKLLCDALHVPCIIVTGVATTSNGFTENHAWNIIKSGDDNFHVDVTWNQPSCSAGLKPMYYNVSDDFMRRDHKWAENKWPSCINPGDSEKSVVLIKTPSMLDGQLKKAISDSANSVTLEFEKEFPSSKKIQDIVTSSLNRISAGNNISSYGMRFGSRNDMVTVEFTYR